MTESLGSVWRAVPDWARKTSGLLLFVLVLLVPAWSGRAFKAEKELYLLVLVIGVLLLGKPLYRLFWRLLDRAGVHHARQRWERQPRWIRACRSPLPPDSSSSSSGLGTQPSLTLVVLLAIIFSPGPAGGSASSSCR